MCPFLASTDLPPTNNREPRSLANPRSSRAFGVLVTKFAREQRNSQLAIIGSHSFGGVLWKFPLFCPLSARPLANSRAASRVFPRRSLAAKLSPRRRDARALT